MTFMKKQYISPSALVVSVSPQSMVAATTLNGQEGNSNVNVTPTEEVYDGEGAARRRRRNVWDDEEDYEF